MQEYIRNSGGEIHTALRFLRGLPPFLRRSLDQRSVTSRLDDQLAMREEAFKTLLETAVFANVRSPYTMLFNAARCEAGDVYSLLAREGLDATLSSLHDAGIYLTLSEFKGQSPIERPGLELQARPENFDNPLPRPRYVAKTGGSGGFPRRIHIDLGLLEHESDYHAQFFAVHEATDRPLAVWHPSPPGAVAMKSALIHARLGHPVDRWFSQREPASLRKHSLFTAATILTARLCGTRIPKPEYTPAPDVQRVVSWLAEQRSNGKPAILITTPSACVRTCRAAVDHSASIEGTLFVLVGEPYTPAKAAVVRAAGCIAMCHYAMVETGMIGLACAKGSALDDVHLVEDKIATTQRAHQSTGRTVGALFHTTLLPSSPKVMINVESGDYGVIEKRKCDCGILPSSFDRHLHTIRSYEKLTSEGMCFMGDDLLQLLEHELPARFSGYPTDYQFVEREVDGLPKVSLVVSHAVGALDEDGVVSSVLEFLRGRGVAQRMMADMWAQGQTLRVVRGDPLVTIGGKIQPLQTIAG